jgi:hypothetical protein
MSKLLLFLLAAAAMPASQLAFTGQESPGVCILFYPNCSDAVGLSFTADIGTDAWIVGDELLYIGPEFIADLQLSPGGNAQGTVEVKLPVGFFGLEDEWYAKGNVAEVPEPDGWDLMVLGCLFLLVLIWWPRKGTKADPTVYSPEEEFSTLTSEERASNIAELEDYFQMTSEQAIEQAVAGTQPSDPLFVEWLVLLDRGDLVVSIHTPERNIKP